MSNIDATIEHDGDPPFVWVAEIEHTLKDGCHIFTSKKIPGLLVVHQSQEMAIKLLPDVITELVRRNIGFKCSVKLGGNSMTDAKINEINMAVITKEAA